MFALFDTWLENILKNYLDSHREKIIENTIKEFSENNPSKPVANLILQLNIEANRIYPIVRKSILRDRVLRAKYTFWGTGIITASGIGLLGAFTGGSALPFVMPIGSAFLAYVLSIATIPISYNQRVEGAMDATVASYLNRLQEESKSTPNSSAHILGGLGNHRELALPSHKEPQSTELQQLPKREGSTLKILSPPAKTNPSAAPPSVSISMRPPGIG